ncbi:MAG TPA: thiamine-phosphate kinase [Candidatus Dormibacteraeota bacterium]|nr:thiamine-phosphate kinase [Candidatus Dormibacteraeota bacterium]
MKRRSKAQSDRLVRPAQSEGQIIKKLQRFGSFGDPSRGLRLGIGDDAALFSPRSGFETILTCDWFLEDTHFLRGKHPADSIGWKCLARAVSDVAAMGGTPRCFLLSLAIPPALTGAWLDAFLVGLRRAQRRLGCFLAGGDTTRSNRVLIQVTVVGEVRSGAAVLRSGAKPDDLIYVSGRLGEAESGLRRLLAQKRIARSDPALRKHLYPEPRLRLGSWLAKNRFATAMMDLSDGLSTDLARLCTASNVGARIEASRLPLPSAGRAQRREVLNLALHGGDDYELLFTVSPASRRQIPKNFARVRLTQIGEITRQRTLQLIHAGGSARTLVEGGWDSFREGNI